MKERTLGLLAVLSLFLPTLPGLAAQEPAAPKKWKDSAEFSAVSANGNSKATTLSGKNTFDYAWTRATLEILGSALGSESQDQATAEQYDASQKATWGLETKGKDYLYEKTAWEKNRFAGLRNRYDLSAGLGRALLQLPKDNLIAEVGGGYINEERTDAPRNEFGSGRAYAKYTRTLTATASFSQDAEYLASFKDADDYRVNTETDLIASISTHLSLKASYTWKRVNHPAPGFGKDDTLTSVALIVNY